MIKIAVQTIAILLFTFATRAAIPQEQHLDEKTSTSQEASDTTVTTDETKPLMLKVSSHGLLSISEADNHALKTELGSEYEPFRQKLTKGASAQNLENQYLKGDRPMTAKVLADYKKVLNSNL